MNLIIVYSILFGIVGLILGAALIIVLNKLSVNNARKEANKLIES